MISAIITTISLCISETCKQKLTQYTQMSNSNTSTLHNRKVILQKIRTKGGMSLKIYMARMDEKVVKNNQKEPTCIL